MKKLARSVFASALLLAALPVQGLDLATATIGDLQAAMDKGTLTSEQLVQLYLKRIEAYDQKGPKLNTVLTLNKKALEQARALDAERKKSGPRSALHGIVVLPKDVYDTYDMPTTGGFKPMATSQPRYDSFVIKRLRDAGAVILGKLNMSDWYGSFSASGSSLAGEVISPYNPAKFVGGSSSGTGAAVASWFATIGLGSDTGGSITIPSTLNNLVGFSTTHGLVSRTGMMWSSPRQENGGPMCRSVYDCAAVLDVIAGYDAADLATEAGLGKMPDASYTSFVKADGLKGKRIGVLREMIRPGAKHAEGTALFEQALLDFKKAGAIVVDPAMTGFDLPKAQIDAAAAPIERATAIDKYLANLPDSAPIRSVEEMIKKGGKLTKPTIVESHALGDLTRNKQLPAIYKQQDAIRAALVGVIKQYQLDGLVMPFRTVITEAAMKPGATSTDPEARNTISSYTGLPTIVVPGGFFPSDGMPFGVQFLGTPFSEPLLIEMASGFEAATRHRKSPTSVPALAGEAIAD